MPRFFVTISRPDQLTWSAGVDPVPSYEIEAADEHAAVAAAVERWQREQHVTDQPGYVSVQPIR